MLVYYSLSLKNDHGNDMARLLVSKEEKLARLKELTKKEASSYRKYFVINLAKDGSFTYSSDYDKIEALCANRGYFRLLSNTGLNSAEVLKIYRRKDMIEKGVDDLKNHVDMKRMRTHNGDTTEGKMFCAFVALIVACHIGAKLGDFMRKNSWSKERAITEMEKIRIISADDGNRLAHPVTKRKRLLMEPLGLDPEDLEAYLKGD
jgi:transposase